MSLVPTSSQYMGLLFLTDSSLCKVLSNKHATTAATNALDPNDTLINSLNCHNKKMSISIKCISIKSSYSNIAVCISYQYSSFACLDWSKTMNCFIFHEVMRHRKAQYHGDAYYDNSLKPAQLAELKKSQISSTWK
ncbi:hypothetical protein MTR_2g032140 [Medicago truncatula]|uniref:Uncharacterized protein n=1 Tax=Medicago truncatula TaxID=3880 RepID=A0A072V528_MEDTR|nr:hypothetical protein MTR_2g032140 [Medicago truncatula]